MQQACMNVLLACKCKPLPQCGPPAWAQTPVPGPCSHPEHDMAIPLLLLVAALAGSAHGLPRGVGPTQAALYSGQGGKFTCKDGSKIIPFSQVNDNYCDCPGDGSDEPGSRAQIADACKSGPFWSLLSPHRFDHVL